MSFSEIKHNGLVYMRSDNISAPHAFTTRFGGVSGGIYSSLNLGANRGDAPADVQANYEIICTELGTGSERLVPTKQVHGDTVKIVTSEDSLGDILKPVPYEADALVTTERLLPLIIYTADCMPILMQDARGGCVGACHAGWRGTVLDITGKTVRTMLTLTGSNPKCLTAAIGPGIGPCCFEAGSEVIQAVTDLLGDDGRQFISPPEDGKAMIDLPAINKFLIMLSGVPEENISVSPECTYCNHEKYWSHRHSGGHRGSQASIIMLR